MHLGGKPVRACVVPISAVRERAVTTIEGVSGTVAAEVQEACESIQVPQCGYCQSGQIKSAIALLNEKPKPRDEDVEGAMNGNVCRCATYPRIRQAIHQAAAKLGG